MITVREASDDDGLDVAALLGSVFAEYEGCFFVGSEMPELGAIATRFASAGGRFWVAHRAALGVPVLVGCVGWEPHGTIVELKKLYVASRERRSGLGGRLVDRVEEAARSCGASAIELWSDTRFVTAHRFYEQRGYQPTGALRPLHDASATEEFHFRKELDASGQATSR